MPPGGSFKIRSAYAGGYSEEIKRNNVNIPDKVKCVSCKKVKMQAGFSQKQLDDLRHAILNNGINATVTGAIRCRSCTGGQVVEMKCCICDVVKSLDDFAKAQRHNRDHARCLTCVQHHSDAEAVVDEQKFLADTEHSSLHDLTLSASQMDATSHGESIRRYADSEEGGVSVTNDGWIEKESRDRSRGHTGSGGLAGYHAPSVHSGWASFGLPGPRSTVSLDEPKKNSRFAKIPARVKSENPPPRVPSPTPVPSTMPYDDDDDEAGVETFL